MKAFYTIVLFFLAFAIAYSQTDKRFVHDEFQMPKSRMAEFQSNPDYLVESVIVYKENGILKEFTSNFSLLR